MDAASLKSLMPKNLSQYNFYQSGMSPNSLLWNDDPLVKRTQKN